MHESGFSAFDRHKGYTYSRTANPTVAALERTLGELESALPAACFATGMAALTTLFLSTLEAGVHVVVGEVVYGGVVRLLERFRFHQNAQGCGQSPFEAWLTLRGLKTLPLRMRRHADNALAVARFLAGDPRVERVLYPGLDEFPQADLARRQQVSGGGMVAFEPRGGAAAAERERFPLEVAAPARGFASCIGDRLASFISPREPAPLDIAILGLGNVGQAVYRQLAAQPRFFRVVATAVRDAERHRDGEVPSGLPVDDPWRVLERPADVVVEALPGAEPARALIERALAGGVVPALETASRLRTAADVAAVHGVLNGTCNYVFERLEAGATLADALVEARHRGLAEADATADLDGSDIARKLILLARAAFGVTLAFVDIPRHTVEEIDPDRVRAVVRVGKRLRSVGSLTLRDGRPHAAVRLRELPANDFLAGAAGEENRIVFERRDARPLRLAGKGAGGRPTAEAVLADLFDVWRLGRARADEVSHADVPADIRVERPATGDDPENAEVAGRPRGSRRAVTADRDGRNEMSPGNCGRLRKPPHNPFTGEVGR